jgi:hypothetical protein
LTISIEKTARKKLSQARTKARKMQDTKRFEDQHPAAGRGCQVRWAPCVKVGKEQEYGKGLSEAMRDDRGMKDER